MSESDERELFFQTLDDLFWEDNNQAISGRLVHTEPIKERYIRRGRTKLFPSPVKLNKWMRQAGYTPLGQCFARCYGSGRGTFWTKYPDWFLTGGVTDHKAVQRCVYRRKLYLKVKPLLRQKVIYSVGEVAEIFGTSINTIRAWDRKKLLPAMRSQGGHRRYDLSELVTFKL